MRKISKIISAIVISLTICLTVCGCQFVNSANPPSGSSNFPNSEIAAQSVEFNRGDANSSALNTLPEAVALVERTSVAIEISSSAGSGSGSGVIVDVKDSGNIVYILTCHHVISGGGEITLYIPDEDCNYDNNDYIFKGYIGKEIYNDKAVTLVGGDNVSDIAVIKLNLNLPAISGNKLTADKIQKAIVPAEGSSLRRGEQIFAIGNPLGELPGSIADGVVSYLEREVLVSEVGEMTLMQISVTTNPGNSGGGLYNLKGELVGITNAGNTSYDAINFAIPMVLENGNGFLSIAAQLISTATATNYGYVSGRWNIGITLARTPFSYGGVNYPLIESVVEGSNAASAGLLPDYFITALSWKEKNYSITHADFGNYVGLMRTELKEGDSFTIYVAKKGSFMSVQNFDITVPILVADYIFCDTGM